MDSDVDSAVDFVIGLLGVGKVAIENGTCKHVLVEY